MGPWLRCSLVTAPLRGMLPRRALPQAKFDATRAHVFIEHHASLNYYQTLWSAVVLVLLLAAESAAPFVAPSSPARRLRHAAVNLSIGLFNTLLTSAAFAGLWLGASRISASWGIGLLHLRPFPGLVRGAFAVFLLDLWAYAWHRWNHQSPFLWRYHRAHHSDSRMDVTTASRFHLGELVASSLLRVPIIVAAGVEPRELAAYQLLMFTVVQFHHANVGLPARCERWLRWVIVTPGMHKVHHSRLRSETDSNYSSFFSFWDRLFGSLRTGVDLGRIQFGLDELDEARWQTVRGVWATPLSGNDGSRRAWSLVLWIPPALLAAWIGSRVALWYSR